MPRVSEFYEILITMNFGDHDPPHFHAQYAEFKAVIGISPIRVVRGRLPARVQGLVFEWAALHQDELTDNWRRARRFKPIERIEPLQ